jgi:hypothetical protein
VEGRRKDSHSDIGTTDSRSFDHLLPLYTTRNDSYPACRRLRLQNNEIFVDGDWVIFSGNIRGSCFILSMSVVRCLDYSIDPIMLICYVLANFNIEKTEAGTTYIWSHPQQNARYPDTITMVKRTLLVYLQSSCRLSMDLWLNRCQ